MNLVVVRVVTFLGGGGNDQGNFVFLQMFAIFFQELQMWDATPIQFDSLH